MLIQFSVKNFMSFKEKAVLALNPSVDSEHPENINEENGYKASNLIAIYGANASGKTSLYKAMTVALIFIKNSNTIQVDQPIFGIAPFKFDSDTMLEPSEFEFIFVAEDGNRYVYGFSADNMKVHEEYLYKYSSQRPTLIFERKEEDYEFKSQKGILEPLVRFNTPNKLFLATATNWNTESTMIPYKWFSEKLAMFTDAQNIANISLEHYKGANRDAYVAFTERLLQVADINISKIRILEQMIVHTEHIIGEGDNTTNYVLDMREESLGTNQLFLLGPFLKDAFERGMTIFIDEIDKSLHTFIVRHLINMFRDKEINKSGAQLIFTTHDTSLLSLSTFRRDQVYFTEKNNKTGVSDLYSLDEFGVRKKDNIEKGYLLGRYGAIPYIRGEEL